MVVRSRLFTALAALVLLACNHKPKELAPSPATASPAPASSAGVAGSRRYAVDSGGCAVTLALEGATSATLAAACDLARVPAAKLAALMDDALAGETRRPLFTLLTIAGDEKDGLAKATPTIEERIAVAAVQSPAWDRRRGLPRGGYEAMLPFVRELGTPARLVPELEATLRARGLCLANDTVDLVDTRTVAEHANRAELVSLGALPVDKVPTFGTLAFRAWPAADGGVCAPRP